MPDPKIEGRRKNERRRESGSQLCVSQALCFLFIFRFDEKHHPAGYDLDLEGRSVPLTCKKTMEAFGRGIKPNSDRKRTQSQQA